MGGYHSVHIACVRLSGHNDSGTYTIVDASGSLKTADWTIGLDYWTVWERHYNPARFVVRVVEPKFKFIGFRDRVDS